jgi:hypothetical protein
MFTGWNAFYQMTGSAAAALIGLLFIVATLTSRQQEGIAAGVRLFTTPTVFHLSLVLIVSAVALAPPSTLYRPAAIMTLAALIACAHALVLAVHIGRLPNPSHWSDFWYYGAAPVAAYLVLAAATAAAWAGEPHAVHGVGFALLLLLMLAIRNAWDLITWLAPRRQG